MTYIIYAVHSAAELLKAWALELDRYDCILTLSLTKCVALSVLLNSVYHVLNTL